MHCIDWANAHGINVLLDISYGNPIYKGAGGAGDLEAMKCNNVTGTDFDCFTSQWANRGFETYMLAKAHLNPDRLDYDTLARDYCEHGFGAAAKGDRDELKAAQRGYCEFLRDNAVADVLVCHPSRIASAYYTPYMRGAF